MAIEIVYRLLGSNVKELVGQEADVGEDGVNLLTHPKTQDCGVGSWIHIDDIDEIRKFNGTAWPIVGDE